MSALLDHFVPSRRRERRLQREQHQALHARFGDVSISAPNEGGWSQPDTVVESVPDWPLPTIRGEGSPDTARTLVNSSPELDSLGEKIIVVGSDPDTDHREHTREVAEKNSITITIPLPWSSRRAHSRSLSRTHTPETILSHRASPPPTVQTTQPFVFKPVSDQYMKELAEMNKNASPTTTSPRSFSPPMSFIPVPARTMDVDNRNQSIAVAMLSPVSEDFFVKEAHPVPSPRPNTSAGTGYAPVMPVASAVRDLPPSRTTSPLLSIERDATPLAFGTMPSRSSTTSPVGIAPEEGRANTRSSSRGPALDRTGCMRSSSREPTSRRPMSREPLGRRPMSREPTNRRAMSREPVARRAPSLEPSYRVPMDTSATAHRASLNSNGSSSAADISDNNNNNSNSDDTDGGGMSDYESIRRPHSQNAGVGYYATMTSEYRHIAQDVAVTSGTNGGLAPSDTESSAVSRPLLLERPGGKDKAKDSAYTAPQELVPKGDDLWS